MFWIIFKIVFIIWIVSGLLLHYLCYARSRHDHNLMGYFFAMMAGPLVPASNQWSTKPDYTCECQDCNWFYSGSNGLGLAARHHDSTQHTVRVGVESAIYYETMERMNSRLEVSSNMRRSAP